MFVLKLSGKQIIFLKLCVGSYTNERKSINSKYDNILTEEKKLKDRTIIRVYGFYS